MHQTISPATGETLKTFDDISNADLENAWRPRSPVP
jgi:hypothetical protein